jgi:DNA-binding NtrC family response regulator
MPSILVVDDDNLIRATLYDLFADQYQCHTAETAEKALALLKADSYDVVLTDISMPGLSGLELLGHVLQNYPGTPVIVISGIGDQEHAQGLIRLGAFDYLLKPFRLEVVEDSVARALNQRQTVAEGIEDKSKEGPADQPGEPDQSKADWTIVRGSFSDGKPE